jgi:hypothetical protein
MTLTVRPIELRDANAFVAAHHRHHKPIQGHRFSLAVYDDDRLCGVAIAGRPVNRAFPPLEFLEITRCATDGTYNAVSCLYGAVVRAAKAMGYSVVQTYTLPEEGGASMRAAGFTLDIITQPATWTGRKGREGRRSDQPQGPKVRWRKHLKERVPA